MKRLTLALLLIAAFAPSASVAVPLQILHTNDLHSHFGRYAAMKAVIERLKREAAGSGIETLLFDGGDFSEGAPGYFSAKAEYSWRTLDAVGYDAVVLGNHDYLMGQGELDALLGRVSPGFALLGANFSPGVHERLAYPVLDRTVRPYAEFDRAGVRIAVLGLANEEFEYRWLLGPMTLDPPLDAVDRYLPDLRSRADFVFALTHIGTAVDRALARGRAGIDLVVGGHWHEYVRTPYFEKNPAGRDVPVVQAGDHARVVGRLVVDLERGKPLRVLSYGLVPVPADGPEDEGVAAVVREARDALEGEYGEDWLSEEIGHSDVPLTRPTSGQTEWGALVGDAIREATRSDLAVDAGDLFGVNQPAGPVTREKILGFCPRMFSLENRMGWTVWTAKVYGWVLKFALEQAYRRGVRLVFSNLAFRVEGPAGKEKLKDMAVGGVPLKALKSYRVALPEGIGRAIDEIRAPLKLFFRAPRDSGVPVWTAIERKLREIGTVPPGYGGSQPPMPSVLGAGSPAGC